MKRKSDKVPDQTQISGMTILRLKISKQTAVVRFSVSQFTSKSPMQISFSPKRLRGKLSEYQRRDSIRKPQYICTIMRKEKNMQSVGSFDSVMDTITKSPKHHKPQGVKHTTSLTAKPKSKDHVTVPRQRRYSVDIISSKPIICHAQKDKNEKQDDKRLSQRRLSLCSTKSDQSKSSKEKDTVCLSKQSEVKSILKSGQISGCNSFHSLETESSTSSEDKQSSDIKCSYRLPKSTGAGKLRKSVSFREDDTSTASHHRRFSSPAMDLSPNYLLSPLH